VDEQVVLTGHHPMRFSDLLDLIREIVGPDVAVDLEPPSPQDEQPSSAHYSITPYTFRPRPARKLVSNYYTDMGQGIVDCLQELAERERQPQS
jgi:UDP-glucose 4-epimerase